MQDSFKHFWHKRRERLRETLEKNAVEAHLAEDPAEAKRIVLEAILPRTASGTVTYGDAQTCMDCSSPDRICRMWSIVEHAFPKGRIKVILINGDLGL